jgi:DNA repair exonuclease SbcCD ATPase subunit
LLLFPPLKFGGGMESFIILLAFKITLTKYFNISQTGILILDEGVSVLDNINRFPLISTFIRQYYDYIILFSHISSFDDFIAEFIEIIKTSKMIF